MLKLRLISSAVVLLGLVAAVYADEPTDSLHGIKCPVSDEQVTQESVEYRGAKLYFCCPDCAATFQEDPKTYAAKANLQLVATKQAKQVACVFCKKEQLNPDTEMEIAGVKIQFGCYGCMEHVKKAEDKIEAAFNDEQFENGFQVKKG